MYQVKSETDKRIIIEHRICTQVVRDLLAAGYAVTVDDGEETTLRNSRSKELILAAMFSTDEDTLYVRDADGKGMGWVRFIYGNDGHDVIADHTINLEAVLKPASELADKLAA